MASAIDFRGRATSHERLLLREWLTHLVDIYRQRRNAKGEPETDVQGEPVYERKHRNVRCFIGGRRVRIASNTQRIELSDGEMIFHPDENVSIDDLVQNPRDRVGRKIADFTLAKLVGVDLVNHPQRGVLVKSAPYLRG